MTVSAKARIIRKCLEDLGIDVWSEEQENVESEDDNDDTDTPTAIIYAASLFAECDSLEGEFTILKKFYHARILQHHPDKGGKPEDFRKTRAAFTVLRDMKAKESITTFLIAKDAAGTGGGKDDGEIDPDAAYYDDIFEASYQDGTTPSYEYYEAAAEEEEPGYKVELAKTGRSQCAKCKKGGGKAKNKAAPVEEPVAEETAPEPVPAEEPTNSRRNPRRSTRAVVAIANNKTKKAPAIATTAMVASTNYIPKGDVRVGSLDERSGSYGRWHHLPCWRVPYRVWAGLTEPTSAKQVEEDLIDMEQVLLIGVRDLPPAEMQELVEHVMQPNNWAKKINWKRKKVAPPPDLKEMRRQAAEAAAKNAKEEDGDKKPAAKKRSANDMGEENIPPTDGDAGKRSANDMGEENVPPADGDAGAVAPAAAKKPKTEDADDDNTTAMVVASGKKAKFAIPRSGMDGAQNGCFADLRFVLTGVFPQVGGGTGLNQGKDKIKGMIEDFGGKVTGSISGKTNFLVVGKSPGASKVGKAQDKGIPMLDIQSLKDKIMGVLPELEKAEAPAIQSFSAGYQGNAIGYY